MATEAGIYAALTDIFNDVFQREISLQPYLTAKDVAGWDSFKQVEIIMAVEERFAIRLTSRELDSLHSVGDLVRVVISRTAAT